jgi:hypothetical protein
MHPRSFLLLAIGIVSSVLLIKLVPPFDPVWGPEIGETRGYWSAWLISLPFIAVGLVFFVRDFSAWLRDRRSAG